MQGVDALARKKDMTEDKTQAGAQAALIDEITTVLDKIFVEHEIVTMQDYIHHRDALDAMKTAYKGKVQEQVYEYYEIWLQVADMFQFGGVLCCPVCGAQVQQNSASDFFFGTEEFYCPNHCFGGLTVDDLKRLWDEKQERSGFDACNRSG